MLTAEELRLKRQRRRRILVTVLLLLIAIGLTALLARPTRNAIKGWQARRHAQKAFTFIAQENWTGARDEATAAYQLRSSEPEAVRAIARLLTRVRQPQALEYWDQLAHIAPLTPDDLRDDAAVALMTGDLHRADTAVKKLLAASPTPADFLLDAQLAAQSGNFEVARADSQKVISDPRASSREQLQATMLAFALTGSAQAKESSGIWRRIGKIAQGKDAASLDALMVLAQRALSERAAGSWEQGAVATPLRGVQDDVAASLRDAKESDSGTEHGSQSRGYKENKPDNTEVAPPKDASAETSSTSSLDQADVAASLRDASRHSGSEHGSRSAGSGQAPSRGYNKELSAALEAHPLARAPHKLVALDLLERADATQRNALIERAISQFKDGAANDIAALARWLNAKGEHQRVIDVISIDQALKNRDAFLQYLDALGALGRWVDIKQLLGSERFPLDSFLQCMYLARCSTQLGEKTAADNNWQRAIEAAAGDPANLMQVAEFAEKNARTDVADNAYNNAIAAAPKLGPAYQGRLRVARAQRNTAKMHEVLAQMLTLWPNEIAIQNDEAYTRALLLPTKSEMGDRRSEFGGTGSIPSTNQADVAASLRDGLSQTGGGHGSRSAGSGQAPSRGYKEPDNTDAVPSTNQADVAASLRDGLSQTGGEHGSRSAGSGQAPSRGYNENKADNAEVVPPSNEAIDIAAAEEIEKLAEKLVEREPKSLPHRTLLALARLRGGHRTSALEAYNVEVPEEVITPSGVAVRAAVLYANGRVDEAKDLIKQISPDQLLVEERALIAPPL
jgi:hypothetical protein